MFWPPHKKTSRKMKEGWMKDDEEWWRTSKHQALVFLNWRWVSVRGFSHHITNVSAIFTKWMWFPIQICLCSFFLPEICILHHDENILSWTEISFNLYSWCSCNCGNSSLQRPTHTQSLIQITSYGNRKKEQRSSLFFNFPKQLIINIYLIYLC